MPSAAATWNLPRGTSRAGQKSNRRGAYQLDGVAVWVVSHCSIRAQVMGHAVSPKFNSLAAFRVGSGAHPLPHRVTAVDAPRGSLPRLAITGWYTIPGADPRAVSPEILNEEKGR